MSIEARDIRIGNVFIRELRNERGLEYDHDFILTEEWMGKLFGNNIGIALQDLFPVPLTPEILEACGFYQIVRFGEIWTKGTKLAIQKDSVWWWTNCWVTTDANEFETLSHWAEIKSLHQLQNLYYALTGKELTYKPI